MNTSFTKTYFPEWHSRSLWLLLLLETIIYSILITTLIITSTFYDDIFPVSRFGISWLLVLLISFGYFLIILVTVYAPYQHHMFPLWYKIFGICWYGFVLTLWIAQIDFITKLLDLPQIYINTYTPGYWSAAIVTPFLLPFLIGLFGVNIGWQIIEIVLRGYTFNNYQKVNLFGSVLLYVSVFFIVYFIKKCNGNIIRFPLISSKNSVKNSTGKQQWCCQRCLLRCCNNKCSCCTKIWNIFDGPNNGFVRVNNSNETVAIELQTKESNPKNHLDAAMAICRAFGGSDAHNNVNIKNVAINSGNVSGDEDNDESQDNINNIMFPYASKLSANSMSNDSIQAMPGGSRTITLLSPDSVDERDKLNSKINFNNNEELMSAMKDIISLPAAEQYNVLHKATSALYLRSIATINTETRANYERLLQRNRICKPITQPADRYSKSDKRYLELNTLEPDDGDESESSSSGNDKDQGKKSMNSDRVTKWVMKQMNKMVNKEVKGKAVGSDRAYTLIGDTISDGIKINLTKKGFRNPNCSDLIDDSILTDNAGTGIENRDIILIEAGTLIGDITDYYWPPDQYGSLSDQNGRRFKTLPNRGGYKWLSIVGLASVGAMGYSGYNEKTGCNLGALQSLILSFRLLTIEDSKIKSYQIEPASSPIHNSNAKQKLSAAGVTLIQDDKIFSDAITSFGTYGVITHAYVQLEDAYYLDVYRDKIALNKWEERFKELTNDESIERFKCWFNPYHVSNLVPASMVTTWYKRSEGPPNTPSDIMKYGGNYSGKIPLELLEVSGYTLQSAANAGLWQAVAAGLDILQNEGQFSNDSKMLTMALPQALDLGVINAIPNVTNGISFPVVDTIDAVNSYIKFLNKQVKNGIFKPNLCVTSTFALRFSKQSFGSMSCAGEYDVAWIEQPIVTISNNGLLTQIGYDTAVNNGKKLLKRGRHHLFENFDAKLHWGLWFNADKPMNEIYPWFQHISNTNKQSFIKNYKKFNKDKLFSNIFTSRSGLDGKQAMIDIEKIALEESLNEKADKILKTMSTLIGWTTLMFVLLIFPTFLYTFVDNTCLLLDGFDSLYPWPYWIDFFIIQGEAVALIAPLVNNKLLENDERNAKYWLYHCIMAFVCCLYQLSQFVSIFFHNYDENGGVNKNFNKYIVYEVLDGNVENKIEMICDENGYGAAYYGFMSNCIAPIMLGMQVIYALKLYMFMSEKKSFLCFSYNCMK